MSILQPSARRGFDIYVMNETQPVLLLSKDAPLSKDSSVFKNNADRLIYIPAHQLKSYRQQITGTLEQIINDPTISKRNKMYAVYVSLTNQLERLISEGKIADIEDVDRDISLFIAHTLNDTEALGAFLSMIKSETHNLAIHMFNVGTYATTLTHILFPDISRAQLEKIARGYFLHDIGMIRIDKNIVNKKGKLTPEEFEEIKKHPLLGVEILKNEMKILDQVVLKIVLEHHERKDGSGYPYGKTDINRFARICAMCDVFDALTSKRDYRKEMPKTTFEALKEEKEFFINEFGKEYYEAFVKCLGLKTSHKRSNG